MDVLIVSKNNYLAYGLRHLISDMFLDCNISISKKTDHGHSLEIYDAIFVEMHQSEMHLCHTYFKKRKKGGKVFFLIDLEESPPGLVLPACVSDASLLFTSESIDFFKQWIELGFKRDIELIENITNICDRCNFKHITYSQRTILIAIRNGYTVKQISTIFGLSIKTVFSQIDRVKKNFLLRNTRDLWGFINLNSLSCNRPVQPKKPEIIKRDFEDAERISIKFKSE